MYVCMHAQIESKFVGKVPESRLPSLIVNMTKDFPSAAALVAYEIGHVEETSDAACMYVRSRLTFWRRP